MRNKFLLLVAAILILSNCTMDEKNLFEKQEEHLKRELILKEGEDVLITVEDMPSQKGVVLSPNELIVEYTSDITQEQKNILHKKYGVIEDIPCNCGSGNFSKWTLDDQGTLNPTKEAIRGNSGGGLSGWVAQNFFYGIPTQINTNPSYISLSSLLSNPPNQNFLDHVGSNNSNNIVIAVIDSGIDTDYQNFSELVLYNSKGSCQKDVSGWDFVKKDAIPNEEFLPFQHGTNVIYVIHNELKRKKIPHEIMPIKVADKNGYVSLFKALCGLQYAIDNDVDVVNMSMGWTHNDSYVNNKFIKMISSFNGVVVASAGNDGSNNDVIPYYPASYKLDNIISVAAAERNGSQNSPSSYSNYGKNSVDFYAYGDQRFPLNPYNNSVNNNYIGSYNIDVRGTSYAAPVITAHIAEMIAIGNSTKNMSALLRVMKKMYGVDISSPLYQNKPVKHGVLIPNNL